MRIVASLADAWIKMCLAIDNHKAVGVASLADAWIKIIVWMEECSELNVASLADAWIKILSASKVPLAFACRIPRGCVD